MGLSLGRGNIDFILSPTEDVIQKELNENEKEIIDYKFEAVDNSYIIKLITYKFDENASNKDKAMSYAMFLTTSILNIAGDEKNITAQFDMQNEADIKGTFGADKAYAVYIVSEELSENSIIERNYCMVQYLMNFELGLICKLVMFDSTDIMQNTEYIQNANFISTFRPTRYVPPINMN